jgi:hypothetical protein
VRVFVSSTYHDLLSYRAAATRAIITTGNLTKDMLYWTASETPPAEESLAAAAVLGSRDPADRPPVRDGAAAIPQVRHGTRNRRGRESRNSDPRLCRGPDAPVAPDQIDTDPSARDLLAQFTRKVRDCVTVNTFSSPESLELAITRALAVYVSRHREANLPPFARQRMVEVSRPESLRFAPDAVIQIGRAPDGAPLLLLVDRSISFENELYGIAAKLRRHAEAPIIDEIRSRLNQAAADLAATHGIHQGEVEGSDATFYVPKETLTELMPPNLFPLILAEMRTGRSFRSARPDISSPAVIRNSGSNRDVAHSGPVREVTRDPDVFRDSLPDLHAATLSHEHAATLSHELPSAVPTAPVADPYVPGPGVPAPLPVPPTSPVFAGRPSACFPTPDGTGFSASASIPPQSPGAADGAAVPARRARGHRGWSSAAGSSRKGWSGCTASGTYWRRPTLLRRSWTRPTKSRSGGSERTPSPPWPPPSLKRLTHKIIVPRSAVMDFVLEVVDEVAGLHARGQVHGDIKPNNILLSRGDSMLIDNGELSVGDICPTVTLDWSPAEQLLHQPISFTADVYCLGLLLLHVLDASLLGREAT